MLAQHQHVYASSKIGSAITCPHNPKILAFVSQFVEIADNIVFTVQYSVRGAQMVVYELLGLDREIPAISRHD